MKKSIFPILALFLIIQSVSCSKEDTAAKSGTTKNGSLSRVISIGNYIYAVDDNHLITINAGDPTNLSIANNISLGANIQTIYHYNGSLFIGSSTQMYVYNIRNNPAAPSLTSSYTYPVLIEPRDPILALDSVIYSTSTSTGWSGVFRVFDSRDLTNPVLLEENSLHGCVRKLSLFVQRTFRHMDLFHYRSLPSYIGVYHRRKQYPRQWRNGY